MAHPYDDGIGALWGYGPPPGTCRRNLAGDDRNGRRERNLGGRCCNVGPEKAAGARAGAEETGREVRPTQEIGFPFPATAGISGPRRRGHANEGLTQAIEENSIWPRIPAILPRTGIPRMFKSGSTLRGPPRSRSSAARGWGIA